VVKLEKKKKCLHFPKNILKNLLINVYLKEISEKELKGKSKAI